MNRTEAIRRPGSPSPFAAKSMRIGMAVAMRQPNLAGPENDAVSAAAEVGWLFLRPPVERASNFPPMRAPRLP